VQSSKVENAKRSQKDLEDVVKLLIRLSDEDQSVGLARDPVAPAVRSVQALKKVHRRTLDDGTGVHSFLTLLRDPSSILRNTCRRKGAQPDEPSFTMTTTPSAKQKEALELIDTIVV